MMTVVRFAPGRMCSWPSAIPATRRARSWLWWVREVTTAMKGARNSHRTARAFPLMVALFLAMGTPSSGRATDDDFASASLVAVGGTYTVVPDAAALIWVNPAVASLCEHRGGAEFSYRRLYDLDALEEITAAARVRFHRRWEIGGGFSRFGDVDLYQETRATATVARTLLTHWAVGGSWQVERVEFGDNEERFAGSHLGLYAAGKPAPHVLAGAAVRHISLDRIYDDDDRTPLVELSASWAAPPEIMIGGIWTIQRGENRFGLGQRLTLTRGIEFLSGVTFDPVRYMLGARLSYVGGVIEYAYQSHPDLGGTHVFGFGWRW